MSEAKSLVDISSTTDTAAPKYIRQLKSLYRSLKPTTTSDRQWPPPPTKKVLNLAMIKDEEVRRRKPEDPFVGKTNARKRYREKSLIKLNDIFKVLDNAAKNLRKRKIILMEGAPGCGKSTLSIHISQQWGEGKLFQEFEAVILVRLRDPAVQSAKSVTDLFPFIDDPTVTVQQVIDEIHTTKFENVLFILDGWDELPTELRNHSKNSIFLDLIKGQIKGLEGSTIIVTSRPAIAPSDQVTLRIEILGFTPDELNNYFTECLDGDAEAVENLKEKIDENPAIAGSCRLPLNANILVHLYKYHLGESLPTSQYGIFSLLVCTFVSRHLKERTEYKDVSTFKTLNQILDADVVIAKQFKSLCKLAYEGVMKDEIVFSSLPPDVDSLSLLQGVESLIKKGISYNFIHLSIQELLAAFYMTQWLTESEQVLKFKQLIDQPRFSAVFQFYAAITKLKIPGISDIVNEIGIRCGVPQENPDDEEKLKTLLVSLLNCLNEAQDQSLCELIIKHLQKELNLGHTTIIPADCLSIGYFLFNIYKDNMGKFQVSLFNCSIDDQCCKYLVKSLQIYLKIADESTTVLDMDLSLNHIGKKGGEYLSQLLQLGCIGALRINGNRNLSDIGAKYISEQLPNNTLLKELSVFNCGITTNAADDIATALMTNKSLKVLNVGGNAIYDVGVKHLANALEYNQTLESLNLACCGMTDNGLQSLVDSLRQNTSLMTLKLYNFLHREDPNRITDEGIQELFSCITKHPTLLTLVLPMEFESSLKDIQEDINDARKTGEMVPIKLQVEGHTLAEIKNAEEEKNKATKFQDQKSASFRYAEEEAEIPFLHHEVLECDHRGLTHTISDHDITLRVPEGAVSKGKTVHFELGVTMYGRFGFPENTRPISPIIWVCLLEENYELQKMFEFSVPHFLTYLTKQRIQHLQIRIAKAYHKDIEEEDKKFNTDCVYNFHLLDSQPSFVSKNERDFAILASKHYCFHCLLAPNTPKLAEAAGYCLVRIEPLPNIVCFSATFFYKHFINSLKCQFGNKITYCRTFKFRRNEKKEPYIRMIIPSDSEYPTEVKVTRNPTDLVIKESEIDFWKYNQDCDYMELVHKMRTYPPQLVVVVMMDSSLHSYKLPIKFEGYEENFDTELMFPLENPVLTPLMLEGHTLAEIKHAEEEKNEVAKSQDQKSASFRYAEEEAEIPFLHHEILECDHRGLIHTISDHDITLRVPEGAVSKGETVHFELGVSMYGPFQFPENTRPISPIIWLCLLEENYTLKGQFEMVVPHFLMYLSEHRIRQYKVCFAKAHHRYSTDKTDTSYIFYQFDSQPSFVVKDNKYYAVLTSNHCCLLSLLADKSCDLAKDAGYCLVRIESSPYEVYFVATFFMETWFKQLREQFGINDDKIAHYNRFKFKENKKQGPHLRMIIPADSEYPSNITVAREPTNMKIAASKIDFWNQKQEFVKREFSKKMYPPRVKVTILGDFPKHKFIKLPIKFEGCLNDDLDTELIFPLISQLPPLTSPAIASDVGSSASATPLTGNSPLLEGRVTFKHVTLIKWKDDGGEEQLFYLIDKIAHKWRTIGQLLGLDYPKLESLAQKHRDQPEECCGEVLGLWLENPPNDYSTTWQGLIDLLKHSKLSEVVTQLRNALSKATDL